MHALVSWLWSTMFRVVAVLLPAVILLTLPTIADDPPQRVLRVGYEEFRPYSFTDQNGLPRGYSIDLIRELARDGGYRIEFIAVSNPGEMLAMLTSGQIDVTSLLAVTPDREKLGTFTLPLGQFASSLFVLESSPYHTADDLAGRSVGAVAGSFAVTAARQIPFAVIVDVETQEALVLPALSGSVEAVASATETFQAHLRALDLEGHFRLIEPPLLAKPRGFIVSAKRQDVLSDLNAAIVARTGGVELDLLQARWFGRPKDITDQKHFLHVVLGGLAVSLLVFAAILFAVRAHRRTQSVIARNRHNAMLVDALNGFDLAVIIFDRDLRTIHWNDGMARCFPSMLPHLRAGVTMPELIALSYANGTTAERKDIEDARRFSEALISDLHQRRETTRVVKMADGRTYEAFELLVGDGMIASIRKDITRQEKQAEEIRAQADHLQAANDRLREFSAIAAHDLRGPLRQQGMLLEFVAEDISEDGTQLPAGVSENLDIARERVSVMSKLIEDLLAYARTEAADPDAKAIDPAERIDDIVNLAAVPSDFSVIIADNLPGVLAPPTAFDLVIRNLIANAAHHHDKERGKIWVRGKIEDGEAIFEIEDDGPGIPAEFRGKVFRPFQRLDWKTAGSGLGLSFVQRTVQEWGGWIAIDDAREQGTIIRFAVPVDPAYRQQHVGASVERTSAEVLEMPARHGNAA